MKGKKKIILGIGLALLLLAVAGAVIYYVQVVQAERKAYETYLEGFELYKNGEYERAEKLLLNAKDYGETQRILEDLYYKQGVEAFEKNQYAAARELFLKNPDYQDSADYIKETAYQLGISSYNEAAYDEAEAFFDEIPAYKDTQEYVNGIAFARLKNYFAAGDYDNAEKCLLAIPERDGVQPYGIVLLQAQAQKAFENLEHERSLKLYERAMGYAPWVEAVYKPLSDEQKNAEYDPIRGDVGYEERLKQIEEAYAVVEREYQTVLCLRHLVNYYNEEMKEKAAITQVDEVRVAKHAYSSDNVIPVVMIAYKETVTEKKKEKQQQAYAVYNETDFYAICHSLKEEEIDKSNSSETQAFLRIAEYWEEKGAVKMDMERLRRAMGWQ